MAYTRITALWSGAAGLPGYTRLRFDGDLDSAGAAAAAGRIRAFFDSIKTLLPSGVNIGFAEAAQVFDVASVLTGEVQYAPPLPVAGSGAGGYSAASGCVVNWLTGAVRNGRKVRGRTFLVPLANTGYQSDGTLAPATVTTVTAAAQALLAGTPAMTVASVYSGGGGGITGVTGATVPDRAAVLRSRRD